MAPERPVLSRARWATRAQFFHLGFVGGVWGVHVPSVKATYSLDERSLAGVLLASSVGSLLTLAFAGRTVARLGVRATTWLAGICFTTAFAACLHLPGAWFLLPIMLLMGGGESVYDVAINAEGTTLEVLSKREVMSGFHGMFSLGAMAGSAAAALMLRMHLTAPVQLLAVALAVAAGISIATRGMLPQHPAVETAQAHFAWPRGTLLIIGLLTLCGMMAEGVMYNWSVLYVQQELHAPQESAALGYVAFAGATAGMRFTGDYVRARMSERAMLRLGPSVAAAAMLIVLLVGRAWVALLGFAIVGIGLATIVPILYNAATRVQGVSRSAAIAAVSSIGYVGFMVGPPIVGSIAHATSLTAAMGVLVAAATILALGSGRVPTAATAPRDQGVQPQAAW